MPLGPSERIACRRPSQELKSPTTLTARAAGRPHRECRSGTHCTVTHVRAQLLVELLVPALADQMEVELTDRRLERIRIVDREASGCSVIDVHPIANWQLRARHETFEDPAGMHPLERDLDDSSRSRARLSPRTRPDAERAR